MPDELKAMFELEGETREEAKNAVLRAIATAIVLEYLDDKARDVASWHKSVNTSDVRQVAVAIGRCAAHRFRRKKQG